MNYDHKSLLDKRREGQEFSLADINRALQDAGDIAPSGGERVDTPIPVESWAAGEVGCEVMVEPNQIGLRKEAWQGYSRYLDARNEQATK